MKKFLRARCLVAALAALPCAAIAAFILLFPGAAACSVVRFGPFEPLAGDVLVQAGIPAAERPALIALHGAASARITAAFGAPRAHPAVIFLKDSEAFALSALGDTGSTHFSPAHACTVIGVKGRNVDVIAHELMHAELFARVGFMRRRTAIPVWFDEGVAMQVDSRSAYTLHAHDRDSAAAVRGLVTHDQFFGVRSEQLTRNYSAAKVEVARWLDGEGPGRLYRTLERIRGGASLEAAMKDGR